MQRTSYPIPDITPALRATIPGFDQLRKREQRGLQVLVIESLNGARRHNANAPGENADSFSSKYLRRLFGRTYCSIVALAYERAPGAEGFGPGRTKKSTLNPVVRQAVGEHLRTTQGEPLVDAWTGRPVSRRVQGTGVYRYDLYNNVAKSAIRDLSPFVRIDVNAVRAFGHILRTWLASGAQIYQPGPNARALRRGQVQARADQCDLLARLAGGVTGEPGVLVQRYREYRNSRLVGVGAHLQGMSREVRAVALGYDSSIVDRDLDAAHPHALYWLALAGGFDAGAILEFVQNKGDIRRSVARDIGAPVDQVKSAMTAIFYGVQRTACHKGSLYHTFDGRKEIADLFIRHPAVQPLFRERANAARAVLNSAQSRAGRIRNAMGRERVHTVNKKQVSKWKLLSHLLTGVEALAMQTAVLETMNRNGTVHLLCFDGFVSDDTVGVDVLQAAIHQSTGIPYTLSSSILSDQVYID